MRKAIAAIVVVILIVIAWLAIAGNDNNSQTNNQTSPSKNSSRSPANNNPATEPSAQAVATNEVEIEDMAFKPADITIKKGTTVTWTNKDSLSHTVTETDSQTGPNSSPLSQDESYTFTYNQAGTFTYHCSIHPEMTGKVVVTE